MTININKDIIRKYDVSGPRYTSYPTAPQWKEQKNSKEYEVALSAFGRSNKTLSVYVHIPFCQSLCSYCGCNVVIRKQEQRFGNEYIDYLEKEIDLAVKSIGEKSLVKQFHWGGGTPTFLDNDQIRRLYGKLNNVFDIDPNGEIAIEIDPRTIDFEKLKVLREVGFNRISLGVQDFNEQVQKAVNRIQPFELVEQTVTWCRDLGFSSINFDLIYGLPYQTIDSFYQTIDKVNQLRPERIALYSFAYVPWLKKHQKKMDEGSFPDSDIKLDIFLNSREKLLDFGYEAIAMDHFALKEDELAKAYASGVLYRNFMGYTVKPADEYIGFGVSSIGFIENSFFQNAKTLPQYYSILRMGHLPIERGMLLSDDDLKRRWTINSLMCRFKIDLREFKSIFNERFCQYFQPEKDHIFKCVIDELLEPHEWGYQVSDLGKLFIRNICMGFDIYLKNAQGEGKYSKTI